MFGFFRKHSGFCVILCVLSVCFLGCVSSGGADSVVRAAGDERQLTAVKGISRLLQEKNFEAAYTRFSDSFKTERTLAEFNSEWQDIFDRFGECSFFSADFFDDGMKFYVSYLTQFEFEKGPVFARFTFPKETLYAMNIQIYENEMPAVKNDYNAAADKERAKKFTRYDLSAALESESLKDLCAPYFKLGCGLTGYSPSNNAIKIPEYMEIVDKHFSSCTMTNLMKPSSIMNQNASKKNLKSGSYAPYLDFSEVDKTLQWCKEHNVKMRGHTLVWHTQVPDWFFYEDYEPSKNTLVSRGEMILRLDAFVKEYLTYVQENFPGVVYCWDVVNEAVDPSNGDKASFFMCRTQNDGKPNLWYFTIGADYPEVSFRIARKYAAPGVSLFYNDYGTTDRLKRECIYKLCKDLKEKGLIDGIGMQSYWDMKNPSLGAIAETINYYAELGLEIQLTEWSMNAPSEDESGFYTQAERYASVFRLLQKLDTDGGGSANITCVSFFGVMDKYLLYGNDTNNTRLFDGNFQPKPVFYSVLDTFKSVY